MEAIPIGALFAGTVIVILVAIEAGYLLGRVAHRHAEKEKVPPVSSMAGSILGLLAFMLAFTFGMVSSRYDSRKSLVRQEANAIGTTYLRADFLPEPDRGQSQGLLRKYVDDRLGAATSRDPEKIQQALVEAARIQRQLWEVAVKNARQDPHSHVAALYVESLNAVIDVHALRVAVGLQSRIPNGIWMVLYALIVLGMLAVGFHTAIAGSRRSWASPILACSFAVVLCLIGSLDRPLSDFISVSQRSLANLRASMEAGVDAPGDAGPRP